ncbi:histidine phosphatase family protein [Streptomyces antibioticus]|uniref:Histidine phosphatase family protein n=1 Tax=Streptomyces antibioticus TaxID=1890 RepID=A0AAE7CJ04_STRAT|nr:histidine phosphatase family protein [Streptomyces antibioticus]OOQ55067.1 phosphoglycerate mutase [Streptomyces antibioticus]QIT42709.1 histidine phosphatase family protein [Streptomyces antibioticus]
MTTRLTLITPALTTPAPETRFGDDSPLDAAGLRQARAAADAVPAVERAWCSPTVRCRETAAALGIDAVDAPELAALDAGRWTGEALSVVGAREPEALGAWLADPEAAPHGGESVRAVCDRVATWLEAAARDAGRALVVAEPEVVRAAVVHALGAPESAFWRTDVVPLTAVELSGRSGRWNVRVGRPL